MASRKLVVEILGDVKGLSGALDSAGGKLSSFGASVGKMALGAGAALGGIAAAAVPMISAASDLAETQSKVGVIFGAASKDIEAFAGTAARTLGQSKQQAMNAAATFATFGKSAGLSGKDLAAFSTDLTGLASDLASFNNTSPEEAIEAISSALRGEAEPMRRYGVLLDDATMRQKAFELGLISSTKEALTPANKVLAAQALIMEKTKDAQGDFARTSDGLANKQRILAAQFENVKASIGEKLLPVALRLATWVSEKLLPALAELGAKLDGPVSEAFAAVSAFLRDDLLPVVMSVFGWLRDNVPPVLDAVATWIDEHVVPAVQSLGSWVEERLLPALGKLWASFAENVLPILRDLAEFVAEEVLPVLARIGQWIAEKVLPVVGELALFLIEKVIPAFFEVIGFIGEKVLPKLGDLAAFFRDLPGNIAGFFSGLADTIIAPFRDAFGAIARLWNSSVGKLSFEVPGWVPGIGGNGWSVPKIAGYHTGGTFRAPTPGGAGFAWLRDGERVSVPGQDTGTAQPIIVEIAGEAILNALVRLDRRNGGTPLRVRA